MRTRWNISGSMLACVLCLFFITALSIIALGLFFFPLSLGRFKCLKGSKQPHKCGVSAGERAEWLINTKAVIKKK